MTDAPRGVKVIDLFGLTADDVRKQYPAIYQHVLERVKPDRDENARAGRRNDWWLLGETNPKLRDQLCGLRRFIATVETAKHRTFQFLDASILPDNKLVAIALSDAYSLGVLSSSAHVRWSLTEASWLGVGNDPVYVKSRCFETFPFPSADSGLTSALSARIASLAEDIDAHRKRVLSAGTGLTLTGLYNVLEALREGRVLTAKEKVIHEGGLVAVLKSLHDELDACELASYGWADLQLPRDEQPLLARLVALNAERVAEEAHGNIAYLRPEYQDPALRGKAAEAMTVEPEQATLAVDTPQASDGVAAPTKRVVAKARKLAWPAALPERMKLIATLLAGSHAPMTLAQVAARIESKSKARATARLPDILATLVALGRAQLVNGTQFTAI